jgi:Transglutaminase-like superfamily
MSVAAAAACALVVSQVWLRIAPGAAVRWASQDTQSRAGGAVRRSRAAESMPRAIASVAARLPWQASCLEQGLALVALLSIARAPARLVLGVIRQDSSIRAHAWVESAGHVIFGAAQAPAFSPLPIGGREPCRQ